MGVGKRIKGILEERNMTVVELSDLTKIPSTTLYSMIKRDSDTEKIDVIQKVMDALDVKMEDLVGKRTSGFHYFLCRLRDESQLGREAFSEAVGIPLKRYIRLENGVEEPTEDDENKIATALGLDTLDYRSTPTSLRLSELMRHFYKLNAQGQEKAVESVVLLTKVPEYKKS